MTPNAADGDPRPADDPLCAGCSRPQPSRFEFHCEAKTVWVEELSGFAIDPSPGVLSPGAVAALFLPPQETPEETTIRWWYGTGRSDRQSEVQESPVAIPLMPGSFEATVLVFVLKDGGNWEVSWREE